MSRRRFIQSLIGGVATCLSLSGQSAVVNSMPNSDPINDIILPQMTVLLTIKKVNHYHFPMGRGYRKENGDWVQEDSQQLGIDCLAHDPLFNDNFELGLYFSYEEHYETTKIELVEGSTWVMSGDFSINGGDITIYDPRYRTLNAEEQLFYL